MRVVKPGRKQKGWSKEKTCTGKGNGGGGCGAVLLVEQADIFLTHRHVHVEHDVFHTFKCPCCGVLTDFDEFEVPRGLNVPQTQQSGRREGPMSMDRLHYQLLYAVCHLVDAVKDIDTRLKWLEDNHDMSEHPFKPPRHDVVWDSINISAAQLKILTEEQERRLKPIETDCPNCCAGPLDKHPRSDCPTCKGTGKYEVL